LPYRRAAIIIVSIRAGKFENHMSQPNPQIAKGGKSPYLRRRRALLIWLVIDLAIAAILLGLLLYRPGTYKPVGLDPGQQPSDQYLHALYAQVQRQARAGRPFDLPIDEGDLNRALAGKVWLDPSGQVSLRGLTVTIRDDGITLMGTAELHGADLVVSAGVHPRLDQDGWLHLDVTKVKVGALNLTPVALAIAKRMYKQRLQDGPVDMDDIGAKVAGALLDGAAFEPVLEVAEGHVRLIGLTLRPGRAVLRIAPVGRITGAAGWPLRPLLPCS